MTAATLPVMAVLNGEPLTTISSYISPANTGMIRMPAILTRRSILRIISDCSAFFISFALRASCEAYDLSPTAVSTAQHSPDTTKLPESSFAAAGFLISSVSPVNIASLTDTSP